MAGCEHCPNLGVKIASRGNPESPVVIVADSITPIELARKRIFEGPHNDLLQEMLKVSGIQEWLGEGQEPLYISAMECFHRDKKTTAGKRAFTAAIKACSHRVAKEIAEYPRKLVITLGVGALHSVTGDYKLKISQERGRLLPYENAELGVFVVQHPTAVLRGSSLAQYQGDFVKARELLGDNNFCKYVEPRYKVLTNKLEVKALARMLKNRPDQLVGADIETAGFHFWKDKTLCLGLSWNGKFVFIVPGFLITPELFENQCRWLWHNGKFDVKFLWKLGATEARVDEDTMLMSYSLNETKGIHDLEQVGSDWLGAPNYKNMLEQYLPNKKTSYEVIPPKVLHKYLAIDVALTFQLAAPMYAKLMQDNQLLKCYRKVLIPGSGYLARVEWNGFKTDREWVNAQYKETLRRIKIDQYLFQKMAIKSWGKKVNTNSPKQLQAYLYGHLRLAHPNQKTDRDTLEALPKHPCLEPLLRIRKAQKYLSTYIIPCKDKVDENGRIHASYNLHGTVTGRLSSNGPNMQNIPRKPEIRGMFIAEEGKILVECDLSQAELRSLAQLSNDTALCRIFNDNQMSLHDEVTAEIFAAYTDPHTSAEEKKELKMRGKAVNFGIVYGRQAFSFVAEFDISLKEALRWISKWFERFPEAATFIRKCRGAVTAGMTLNTVFGRRRRFGVITPERRTKLENEASNFPHQSTASDITLMAGIILEPILRKVFNAKIVNTVHDCIVVECDPKDRVAIQALVTYVMQKVPTVWGLNRVPFLAEGESGARWGHLHGDHDYLQYEFEKGPIDSLVKEHGPL